MQKLHPGWVSDAIHFNFDSHIFLARTHSGTLRDWPQGHATLTDGSRVLQDMRSAGCSPDIVTFNSLMDICAKAAGKLLSWHTDPRFSAHLVFPLSRITYRILLFHVFLLVPFRTNQIRGWWHSYHNHDGVQCSQAHRRRGTASKRGHFFISHAVVRKVFCKRQVREKGDSKSGSMRFSFQSSTYRREYRFNQHLYTELQFKMDFRCSIEHAWPMSSLTYESSIRSWMLWQSQHGRFRHQNNIF